VETSSLLLERDQLFPIAAPVIYHQTIARKALYKMWRCSLVDITGGTFAICFSAVPHHGKLPINYGIPVIVIMISRFAVRSATVESKELLLGREFINLP
jgi:hypothetical protein